MDKISLPSCTARAYPVTNSLVMSGKVMDGLSVGELLACPLPAPVKICPMMTAGKGSTCPRKIDVFPGGRVLEAGGTAVHGSGPFLPVHGH